VQLSSAIFVATNDDERQAARQQISFYASTPTYKTVLDVHGWGEVNQKLGALAARGRWDEMPALITDEILNEVAIVAPPEALPAQIKKRYAGLLDRISFYAPFTTEEAPRWRAIVSAFKQI
jgi:hypothetical protein